MWIPLAAAHAAYHYGRPSGVVSSTATIVNPYPEGDRPMLTPHEAAVEHLKTLDRAEHPEIEELLAVVRQHPVEIQRACEEAVKRGEDAAVLAPIRAIADRQAVELQELLDALTTVAPDSFGLPRLGSEAGLSRAPLIIGQPLAGVVGSPEHAAWLLEAQHRPDLFTPDQLAGTFGGAPITQSDPLPASGMGQWGSTPGLTAPPFDSGLDSGPRQGDPALEGIPAFGVEATAAVLAATSPTPVSNDPSDAS